MAWLGVDMGTESEIEVQLESAMQEKLWAKMGDLLRASNLKFCENTQDCEGEGVTDPIEGELQAKLVKLAEGMLVDMRTALESPDARENADIQSPTKEIVLDDPHDTKKTVVKIAPDKIKIIKLEKSPEEIESSKRALEEDVEDGDATAVVPASHKKARVKIEDDEEPHAYMGREGDVPSIYNSIPEPTFHMKNLLNAMVKALELYDDEHNKETAKDFDEYWKNRCAVSSYPAGDLKDELPGEIPMQDFSGQKPGNQISFTTFMGYVEGFFRNFTEEDLRWLGQKTIHSANLFSALNPPMVGPDGTKIITSGVQPYDPTKDPLYVPPLGAHYQDVWSYENEGKPVRSNKLQLANGAKVRRQFATPLGDSSFLQDGIDVFDTCVSTGPLTARLLSAIVPDEENATHDFFNGDDEKPIEDLEGMTYEQIEERLKRELNYLGVYMNVRQKLNQNTWDQDWGVYKEDDEVSKELRQLQRQLKATQMRNNARKEVLIPKVKEQIAWQEYIMIVEDLDKQIEQHYRRRIGVLPKKGTKKKDDTKDDNTSIITSTSFKGLLDKRRRWIEKIGPLFKSNYEMRRMPDEGIFAQAMEDLQNAKDGEDDEGDEGDEGDAAEGEEEVNADQL